MLIRVWGASLRGLGGVRVSVEVDAGRGLPSFQIVGQGDRVVRESRDRVRAAFRQSGLEFPPGRVTVNLAPAEIPKTGTGLDLALAVGIAATRVEIPEEELASTLFVGELGLDGALHPVRGTLALLAAADGLERSVVALGNLTEAALYPRVRAFGANDLIQVIRFLRGETALDTLADLAPDATNATPGTALDLSDVRGQESGRRALEVAAAGGHNLLFIGPPGSGKTLLAKRLPGLLPPLEYRDALEATRIHSVAGTLARPGLLSTPPFRAPHHTTSDAGMAGGGRPLRPGEISLAHRGVLFLDELPEFRRNVLEALRQPLEEHEIRIGRAHAIECLPAHFQLIAAMNPCPCGYRGDARRECSCGDPEIGRYRARLSGPLLDRIDLHVPVAPVEWKHMSDQTARGETSQVVRERVLAARARQSQRYRGQEFELNAQLPSAELASHCPVSAKGSSLLERSVRSLGLSMRAYVRVLRVARTIADLDGSPEIATEHLAEAIGYRQLDASDERRSDFRD
ncbi:MAG: YifB family Mg chelatase-like AAA ATPase [bacterium]|nr:YifB family Mg chelatase-like AAA ATPase [bacterium]